MEKILLIDGHSILNRAFYGVPDLTDSKGRHTNAVYGFLNILFKIVAEEEPSRIAVAFDLKEKTFRHKMYEAYKGTRKPMPAELHEQVPLTKEVLEAMNICVVTKPGYEADDIIGTIAGMAAENGSKVTIVSGDRDLLQLVTDMVTLRIPKTKGGKTIIEDYTPEAVKETYSLSPKQIIDLKGLMGDSSDNIPGLPGVGEKTATKLLLQYETVENVLAHGEEITPNKAKNAVLEHGELATLSKVLATIKTDCDLEFKLADADIENMFNEKAYMLIKEMGFKSMLSKFDGADMIKEEDIEYDICDESFIAGISITNCCDEAAKDGRYVSIYMMCDEENEPILAVIWPEERKPLVLCDMDSCVIRGLVQAAMEYKAVTVIFDVKDMLHAVCDNEDNKGLEYDGSVKDLSVMAYLLNPLKDSYQGVDIAAEYLGRQIAEYKELFGKKSSQKAFAEEKDNLIKYALTQTQVLKESYKIIKNELEAKGMMKLFEEVEMPLVYTLYSMEREGIGVDKEALRIYGESLNAGIDELQKKIYSYAGEEFNINSPKQLGVILFEKMKLPFAKKTKTGYSTSADILEKLKHEDPIVSAVLEYRTLTKLKSTYADGLAGYIEEDGRIRGTFNQTKTATGRISSLEPNLQNIPIRIELGRQIRKVFVPREGCVFLDADYSQIELRVLAHMSGDEELINAYNNGEDIHSQTASKVFHVPVEEVTSDLRRKAKAVNFGIVYGISSFGLSQDIGTSQKEAKEYINRYFETYPKIKAYLDGTVALAKETGFSYTEYGRIRPIPELSSGNFMQRSFGERVAMNAPIQGTAADIMKIAMINVYKRLKDEGLETKLILQVHDELLLEVPEGEIEEAKKVLEEEMVNAASLRVKLEVEVKEGSNWYEAK